MAFVELAQYPSRRAVSVASVVLVHVALGYAFVNGLAFKVITERITVMTGYNVPDIKPPKPIPPEDPVIKKTKIDVPDEVLVKTERGPDMTEPFKPATPMPPIVHPTPPSLPAPVYARSLQVKGDRSTWVTTDDYPADAIRNGYEGRVGITVQVGTDGRVTNCQVTTPTGFESLDKAACYFYSRRARFLPALAADKTPVAASRVDWVRWQLPTQ